MHCRLQKWSYSKYGWQHGLISDNWQGGQEGSAWAQTDRARQHLHQEPAGIPAAKEQWAQFRVRTCADRREHLWEAGEETSFCERSGEKEEPRLLWRTGWGAPLRGEPGQAGRDKIVSEWNAWRPSTLGAICGEVIGENDTGNWIWQGHC